MGQWFLASMVAHLNGDEQAARDWFAAGYEWMQRANNTASANRQMRFRAARLVDSAAVELPEEWDPEAYLPHFDRLVENHPNVPRLILLRGKLHAGAGNREQAMADYAKGAEVYTEVISRDPEDAFAREQQGNVYGRLGLWAKAATDLEAGADPETAETIDLLHIAPVLAAAGDTAKYQAFCEKVIARFRQTERPLEAERAIKATTLLPDVIEVPEQMVAVLKTGLQDPEAQDWFLGWGYCGLAQAQCRAGDGAAALQSVARAERSPMYEESLPMQALAQSLKALAHLELKQSEQAREALIEAKLLSKLAAADFFRVGSWSHDLLIAELLCKEAEQRLVKD